jgi:signal transduction histidine kinase/CheY-like chemotaxis protein
LGPGGNIALFVGLIGFGYAALILRIAKYIFKLYTDSFEARRQLEVALRQAEAAGRAKTRFLASASHDLRQPMHALSLFSAALATHKFEDGARQIVDNINAAVEALSYELDGLLDISKLDAGIVPVNRSNFCLAKLLRRLHEEFSPLAQEHDIKIVLDCPERAMANTDSMLLERIVRNLATNAIHHNTHCDLIFQLTCTDDDWQLTVSDTGRGINPEQHEHIFEEFYQLENIERDRTKGLGLGLSIVSRLSALLGLGMEFESAPDMGTQFRFTIAAADQQVRETTMHSPEHPQQLPDALIVLLVDDERAVLEGMEAILGSLGCRVITADSTETAVSAAMALKPDIALVDLRLRDHDTGLATIERLRSIYPQLPAIVISGDTAPDRLLKVYKKNIPVLTKPVLVGPLTAAIIEHCAPPA